MTTRIVEWIFTEDFAYNFVRTISGPIDLCIQVLRIPYKKKIGFSWIEMELLWLSNLILVEKSENLADSSIKLNNRFFIQGRQLGLLAKRVTTLSTVSTRLRLFNKLVKKVRKKNMFTIKYAYYFYSVVVSIDVAK